MQINEYIKKIKDLGACGEAVKDALNYNTSQELWNDCKRGDWMLWLIGMLLGASYKTLRKCLKLSLGCNPIARERLRKTVRIEMLYASDKKTIAEAMSGAVYDTAVICADDCIYTHNNYDSFIEQTKIKQKILSQCADIIRRDYPNIDELFNTTKDYT